MKISVDVLLNLEKEDKLNNSDMITVLWVTIWWAGFMRGVVPMALAYNQDVKNEAEAYMLKELSLLKWQEKACLMTLEMFK
ncbi:hypothetical protein F0562_018241 [Nyssa sinensis]|uniref:Uncharacterized protein n=1 Tax=Nyssa sinensis TaxID=561372 RepID=A0A5J4ZB36_9ASTE|nr:hypothetical protein F0562_018241 [Nyssa sinensis]